MANDQRDFWQVLEGELLTRNGLHVKYFQQTSTTTTSIVPTFTGDVAHGCNKNCKEITLGKIKHSKSPYYSFCAKCK